MKEFGQRQLTEFLVSARKGHAVLDQPVIACPVFLIAHVFRTLPSALNLMSGRVDLLLRPPDLVFVPLSAFPFGSFLHMYLHFWLINSVPLSPDAVPAPGSQRRFVPLGSLA